MKILKKLKETIDSNSKGFINSICFGQLGQLHMGSNRKGCALSGNKANRYNLTGKDLKRKHKWQPII